MFKITLSGKRTKNKDFSSLIFAAQKGIAHRKATEIIRQLSNSESFIPVYDSKGEISYYLILEGGETKIQWVVERSECNAMCEED